MKKILTFFLLLICAKSFAQNPPVIQAPPDNSEVFTFAEKMPQFTGGEFAFHQYLKDSLNYPEEERIHWKSGTVYISFIIEKDGSVTNVKPVKEVPGAPGLTKEAIRVISNSPKWQPGMMNGRTVRVSVTQPIKFVLDKKDRVVCGPYKTASELGPVYDFDNGRAPEFPGGDKALQEFFQKQFATHTALYDQMNNQRITCYFVVDSTGHVCNVVYDYSQVQYEIVQLVMQMFCTMPDWIPGGSGDYGKNGSINVNTELRAYIELGTYENGKVKTPAKFNIVPLPEPLVFTSLNNIGISRTPPGVYLPYPKTNEKAFGQPPANRDTVYADELPQFPGGDAALLRFIATHIQYPEAEKKAKQEGTVWVSFIVDTEGNMSGFTVKNMTKKDTPGFDKEAERVVSSLPQWKPGKEKGKAVSVQIAVPVKFAL